MKFFNLDDINELRKTKIIILVNHKVYDFTKIINLHPGGNKTIIDNMLKNNYDNYKFHSNLAKKKWKLYRIGSIKNKNKNNCIIL